MSFCYSWQMSGNRKYFAEAVAFVFVGALLVSVMTQVDAWEWFYEFTRRHEEWELDELLLGVPVALLLMTVFTVRRMVELRQASDRLEESNRKLLEARRRIEELQRTKEEFLSYASHELKNPLGGVISALHLVEIANSKEELAQGVALASDAAKSLRTSTMGILDVTRLLMEHRVDNPEPFDPVEMMHEATGPVRAQAEAKGVRFELSVGPGVPKRALGHGKLLLHVVQNLAENAVKFTDKGRVRIECDCCERSCGGLLVTVADTGPGIAPGDADLVFEPYMQGETERVIQRGAGLGLTIAKRLVEVLGGTISVRNAERGGAVFEVNVPLENVEQ